MNTNRIYEDSDGIHWECIGFNGDQYKMKIIDSPYAEIQEGLIQWMDELPGKTFLPTK